MHLSEGVLDARICIGGYAAAAGLAAVALRRVKREQIPKISVMGACFFAASLIHFKVGVTSIHLTLLGFLGIMLGYPAVLAIMVGLFFQAVMFQHGGLTTLGVNTLIFGVSSLLAYAAFTPLARGLRSKPLLLSATAGLAAALAVTVSAALIMLIIRFSGEELAGMALVFSASHGVLSLLEGLITFLAVRQILKLKPEMLPQMSNASAEKQAP